MAALDGQTGLNVDRERRTPAGREDARCSETELMANVSLMANFYCEDENPDPFHLYLDAKSINEQHNCSLDVYMYRMTVYLHCRSMLIQQTSLQPALANFLSVLL